jgi:Coenzyme PQQ synthesis protein D (PqqD)
MTISSNSVVVAVKSQLSCQVDADTVVLHFDKGLYFGLNEVGTLIWSQIQQPRRVQEIRDAILREYEVSCEECEQDLFRLLEELSEKGLVEVRGAVFAQVLGQPAAI